MKITAMMAMAALLGSMDWAAAKSGDQEFVACIVLSTENADVVAAARMTATQVFAPAGLNLEWHTDRRFCEAHRDQVIKVSPSLNTPKDLSPSALAYALPYAGVHIRVFYDLMLATASAFAEASANDVRLTVRLMDYVNLPASTRSEIAVTAKRLLGQAGAAVEFVECYTDGLETGAPACTGSLGPSDLYLRIFQPKLAVKGEQLGYAAMTPEGGAYVTVFMNPGQRKARAGNLDDGVLLGHAVAHEVGHLLLGANSHSSSGIMRPAWRPVDEEWMVKGALVFSAGQAKQMRSKLTARSSQ